IDEMHRLPEESWNDRAIRKIIARLGRTFAQSAFDLCAALAPLSHDSSAELFRQLRINVSAQLQSGAAFTRQDLALSGGELIQLGVILPGPAVGKTLDALVDATLDDPRLNQRETLLTIAKSLKLK
ncbi:MAG: hypothetical protein MK135_11730, partial [Polyangiaceae bacterium]|nr:hypothetical protein [Polyangiaceae bacterium]